MWYTWFSANNTFQKINCDNRDTGFTNSSISVKITFSSDLLIIGWLLNVIIRQIEYVVDMCIFLQIILSKKFNCFNRDTGFWKLTDKRKVRFQFRFITKELIGEWNNYRQFEEVAWCNVVVCKQTKNNLFQKIDCVNHDIEFRRSSIWVDDGVKTAFS